MKRAPRDHVKEGARRKLGGGYEMRGSGDSANEEDGGGTVIQKGGMQDSRFDGLRLRKPKKPDQLKVHKLTSAYQLDLLTIG